MRAMNPSLRLPTRAVWLLACGFLSGCASPPKAPTGPRPDVVLVVLDTLRPDHLGIGGYPGDVAPFLSRLARGSSYWPAAVSVSSWTAPATTSLHTGVHPTRHGVLFGMHFQGNVTDRDGSTLELARIPSSLPVWAELMRAAGYRTYGIAANINIGPEIGFDRGFDRFVRLGTRRFVKAEGATIQDDRRPRPTAESALEQLEEWREEFLSPGPKFLYLHLNDVHEPYHERGPWLRPNPDEEMAKYDSSIGYMDRWLARIWRRLGLDDDTLVIVVSDHGEAFDEHRYRGHSRTLDAEVQRVLFFFRGPGVRPGLHPETVSLQDVLPTGLDLLGLGGVETQGVSLAPLVRGEEHGDGDLAATLQDRPVLGHRAGLIGAAPDSWSVQLGRFKAKGNAGEWTLYDTAADPGERWDLAAVDGPRLARLRALQQEFVRGETLARGDSVSVRLDAADIEALRSLGYAK